MGFDFPEAIVRKSGQPNLARRFATGSGLGLPDAGESRTGHAPLCFDQAIDEGRIHRDGSA
jgi:hypothetical protein